MKRIAVKVLESPQKKSIAQYTEQFIKNNFTEPLEDAEKILHNNVNFFGEPSLGESILQQSLVKGTFSRLSFKRGIIEKEMRPHISNKIEVAEPNSKADFRFIGEIRTADRLANTSNIIEKVIMNFEDPTKVIKNKPVSNNVNKDVTLKYQIENRQYSMQGDIKAGNNANNPFSNVIASIPLRENMENYFVINDNQISLFHIQQVRMEQFAILNKQYKSSSPFAEVWKQMEYLNELPINQIHKNILMQEQIFKAMSLGLNIGAPSFYATFIVPHSYMMHEKFLSKLEPHINANIFDNKKNFNVFMQQAFLAYNETVQQIARNVKANRNLLKESGLEDISNDIFN